MGNSEILKDRHVKLIQIMRDLGITKALVWCEIGGANFTTFSFGMSETEIVGASSFVKDLTTEKMIKSTHPIPPPVQPTYE